MKGIRVVKNQTFRVERGSQIRLTPRYVIESRLTSLAEESSSPSGSRKSDGTINYGWAFKAPLGVIALQGQQARELTVDVNGHLVVRNNLSFLLTNNTAIHTTDGDNPVRELNETARGTCREER